MMPGHQVLLRRPLRDPSPAAGYLPPRRGCSSPAAGPGRAGAGAACCGTRRARPAGRVPRRPGLSPTAACRRPRSAAAAPAATSLRAGGQHRLSARRRPQTRAPHSPTTRGRPAPTNAAHGARGRPRTPPSAPRARAAPSPARRPRRGPAGCWAARATVALLAGHGTSSRFHAASGAAIFPAVRAGLRRAGGRLDAGGTMLAGKGGGVDRTKSPRRGGGWSPLGWLPVASVPSLLPRTA